MRIIFLDIGNTNIDVGIGDEKGSIKKCLCFWQHELSKLYDFIRAGNFEAMVFASVVPALTENLLSFIRPELKKLDFFELGKEIEVPLRNKYQNPHKLGIDRILNAYYVKEKVGYPAICVDLGSAVTIDLISEKAEFLGGIIFPGFNLCRIVLAEKTAKLPLVNLKKIEKIYGSSTEECIIIGITEGISSLIERVSNKFESVLSKKPYKVITGGDVSFVKSRINSSFLWIPNLTLKAMGLIFSKYYKKMQKNPEI